MLLERIVYMKNSKSVTSPDKKPTISLAHKAYRQEVKQTRQDFFATRSPAQAMWAIQKLQSEADEWVRQSAKLTDVERTQEERKAEALYRKARVLTDALNQQRDIEHSFDRMVKKYQPGTGTLKPDATRLNASSSYQEKYQQWLRMSEAHKPYINHQLSLAKERLNGYQPGLSYQISQLKNDIKPLEDMLNYYLKAKDNYKVTKRFTRPTIEKIKQDLSRLYLVVRSDQTRS
jgi:hypothetical protein